jgi:hypothetical protein
MTVAAPTANLSQTALASQPGYASRKRVTALRTRRLAVSMLFFLSRDSRGS